MQQLPAVKAMPRLFLGEHPAILQHQLSARSIIAKEAYETVRTRIPAIPVGLTNVVLIQAQFVDPRIWEHLLHNTKERAFSNTIAQDGVLQKLALACATVDKFTSEVGAHAILCKSMGKY